MTWRIVSRLICPNREDYPWESHASLPTVLKLSDDIVRVFFSPRTKNKSHVAYFDADLSLINTSKNCIINFSDQSVLAPGQSGDERESGIMPSQAVIVDNQIVLTTCCWLENKLYPYSQKIYRFNLNSKNLKIEHKEELDQKYHTEHYRTNPFNYCDDRFKINSWVSGIEWVKDMHQFSSVYTIQMELFDKRNKVSSSYQVPLGKFCAICRPIIFKESETNFKLYFSARTNKSDYKIYSSNFYPNKYFSPAELILEPDTGSDWCNEMVEYPFVFDCGINRYMMFCGNNYGATGLGLAVYE